MQSSSRAKHGLNSRGRGTGDTSRGYRHGEHAAKSAGTVAEGKKHDHRATVHSLGM
jgi:hypothetical protein